MAFLIASIQFSFGLPHALFCFGIHFNAILGNLPSTWPYHVSWFCSISFIIGSSNPICCLIVTFVILSFLDILEDLCITKYFLPRCFRPKQIIRGPDMEKEGQNKKNCETITSTKKEKGDVAEEQER